MAKKSNNKSKSGGVQSVEIGGRVLLAVTEGGGPLALKDIADATDLPSAKAHRYLVSLIRAGLIEQDLMTGKYDLGTASLRVGLAAIIRLNVVRAALPFLARLRDKIGETVHLSVWGDNGPIIVHREVPLAPIALNLAVGSNLSLLLTASGRVFLSWLDKKQTGPLLQQEMRRMGNRNKAEIKAIQAETLRDGFGRSAGDFSPSIASLAAPVFNHEKHLVAVIGTFGYEGSFDNRLTGVAARLLGEAAREVSNKLGFDAAEIQS